MNIGVEPLIYYKPIRLPIASLIVERIRGMPGERRMVLLNDEVAPFIKLIEILRPSAS